MATADEYLRDIFGKHDTCERLDRKKSTERFNRLVRHGTTLVNGFMFLGQVTGGQTLLRSECM